MGDSHRRERRSASCISDTDDVCAPSDRLIEYADISEQREQIYFLLIPHPQQIVVGLSGNCENGRAIHFCIV